MDLKLVLSLAVLVTLGEARPRYIAVPLEDIHLVRHVRSLQAYPQAQARSTAYQQVLPPVLELQGPESRASDRYERQAGGYGGNDHVDYGAYTGGYGAFGWYSDHPVCVNCGYGYH